MKRGITLVATLVAVGIAAACGPQSGVRIIDITETFTVADCNAYPGGAVFGQGDNAYCKVVP